MSTLNLTVTPLISASKDESPCLLLGSSRRGFGSGSIFRYQTWLQNSNQLSIHQKQETLKIQYLTLEELEQRYKVQQDHRIGRGESACIILAKRYDLQAVFLSSDQRACQAAAALGINPLTIPEILDHWINLDQPSLSDFDELLEGMRLATFTLKGDDFAALRSKLTQP